MLSHLTDFEIVYLLWGVFNTIPLGVILFRSIKYVIDVRGDKFINYLYYVFVFNNKVVFNTFCLCFVNFFALFFLHLLLVFYFCY